MNTIYKDIINKLFDRVKETFFFKGTIDLLYMIFIME